MVDEGLGKVKMSVILEDDDDLQIVKVNRDDARTVQKYQIDLQGSFGENINSGLLQKAIITVYKQRRDQLAKKQPPSDELGSLADLLEN